MGDGCGGESWCGAGAGVGIGAVVVVGRAGEGTEGVRGGGSWCGCGYGCRGGSCINAFINAPFFFGPCKPCISVCSHFSLSAGFSRNLHEVTCDHIWYSEPEYGWEEEEEEEDLRF